MHPNLLLQIAVVLLAAKFAGEVFERLFKQPAVLGELIVGMVLGGSLLRMVDAKSEVLIALAEIGAVLLLFEVGLESDIRDLLRVGKEALMVAFSGVLFPGILGFGLGMILGFGVQESVFVGAALTATSVGITARVFGDLKMLTRKECQIVLGAAVIDDVLGLVLLTAISAMAITKSFNIVNIGGQALIANLVMVGAVVIGFKITPWILKIANGMQTRAALSTAALILCFGGAALAQWVQLAPIIGAFAMGLVLNRAEHRVHIEEKIKSVADLFIPLFFVFVGSQVDLATLNPFVREGQTTLALGMALLVVAVFGKWVTGYLVPGKGMNRALIGVGMIPRGEVGLIFANIGLRSGLISPSVFSALLFVVMATTFLTPVLLRFVVPKSPAEETSEEAILVEAVA